MAHLQDGDTDWIRWPHRIHWSPRHPSIHPPPHLTSTPPSLSLPLPSCATCAHVAVSNDGPSLGGREGESRVLGGADQGRLWSYGLWTGTWWVGWICEGEGEDEGGGWGARVRVMVRVRVRVRMEDEGRGWRWGSGLGWGLGLLFVWVKRNFIQEDQTGWTSNFVCVFFMHRWWCCQKEFGWNWVLVVFYIDLNFKI